jgi:hypothetical protein
MNVGSIALLSIINFHLVRWIKISSVKLRPSSEFHLDWTRQIKIYKLCREHKEGVQRFGKNIADDASCPSAKP